MAEITGRDQSLEMGADDFITKPYDKIELLERIKAMVEKKGSKK
jgi:DNA-binding response OmpR family regulator